MSSGKTESLVEWLNEYEEAKSKNILSPRKIESITNAIKISKEPFENKIELTNTAISNSVKNKDGRACCELARFKIDFLLSSDSEVHRSGLVNSIAFFCKFLRWWDAEEIVSQKKLLKILDSLEQGQVRDEASIYVHMTLGKMALFKQNYMETLNQFSIAREAASRLGNIKVVLLANLFIANALVLAGSLEEAVQRVDAVKIEATSIEFVKLHKKKSFVRKNDPIDEYFLFSQDFFEASSLPPEEQKLSKSMGDSRWASAIRETVASKIKTSPALNIILHQASKIKSKWDLLFNS